MQWTFIEIVKLKKKKSWRYKVLKVNIWNAKVTGEERVRLRKERRLLMKKRTLGFEGKKREHIDKGLKRNARNETLEKKRLNKNAWK